MTQPQHSINEIDQQLAILVGDSGEMDEEQLRYAASVVLPAIIELDEKRKRVEAQDAELAALRAQVATYHKALDGLLVFWIKENNGTDYNFVDKALMALLQNPEMPHTLYLEPYLETMAEELKRRK